MNLLKPKKLLLAGITLSMLLFGSSGFAQSIESVLDYQNIPNLPMPISGAAIGIIGNNIVAVGGEIGDKPNNTVFGFDVAKGDWSSKGEWSVVQAEAGYASDGSQLIIAGGKKGDQPSASVVQLTINDQGVTTTTLPDMPKALPAPAVLIEKEFLYVAGSAEGENLFARLPLTTPDKGWEILPMFPGSAREGSILLRSFDNRLYLFGGYHNGEPVHSTLEYSVKLGWVEKTAVPSWTGKPSAVAFGESHLVLFGADDHHGVLAYHTITDTWVEMGQWMDAPQGDPVAVLKGTNIYTLSGSEARVIQVSPLKTKYGWIDHGVVILYLLSMVAVGLYFNRRKKDTKDYFQGGRTIPWWASGMSLFATMASAISLMTMPGKSYSGNWEWYAISIFSAITLPISLFILAPIIRKLNIRTSNEYLDMRFGTPARIIGSMIFVLMQMLGRMAPIMLLPAIALNAITGISVEVCILIMAAVSISYTFMGGLTAVIWTDTIQGFIMVGTIAACLILAIMKVGMSPAEIFQVANDADKLRVFDWNWDITYPTAWLFFIGILFTTLNNIGDQNFVQRVQSTSSIKETQKAIGLQMSVAVMVNALLFAVGTVLFIYYRHNPAQLNPSMKADGIYPFFSAQHLPIGIAGLMVAALLAATLSTISGSICSVANLGVDDFYRRFAKSATEKSSLMMGRILTLVVGLAGTGAALYLANADMPSIWDLALFFVNLVTNGLVGMFALGLLTKRANQTGMIIGVIVGMSTVFLVQKTTNINYWLFWPIGSITTFVVGYMTSLLFPAPPAERTDGLTLSTIKQR